jgi:hypothetical protein
MKTIIRHTHEITDIWTKPKAAKITISTQYRIQPYLILKLETKYTKGESLLQHRKANNNDLLQILSSMGYLWHKEYTIAEWIFLEVPKLISKPYAMPQQYMQYCSGMG